MKVVSEESFQSSDDVSRVNDMVRVTLEMKMKQWQMLKKDLEGERPKAKTKTN